MKFMAKSVLISSLFVGLSFQVMANNLLSRTVEFRLDSPGMPLEGREVSNQGPLGTCYAHAIAQATDTIIARDGLSPQFETSPLIIALEAKNTWLSRIFRHDGSVDGGFVCRSAKRSVLKKGACSSDGVEKAFSRAAPEVVSEYATILFLNSTVRIYLEHKKDKNNKEHSTKIQNYLSSISMVNAYMPDLKTIEQSLKAPTKQSFSLRLLKNSCVDRIELDNFRCKKNRRELNSLKKIKDDTKKIVKSLNQETPVIISYCSKVLSEGPGYRGRDNYKKCGFHASAIIGHRKISDNVEFLVRNSWGTNCRKYSSKWSCEKGQIWVNARDLLANTAQIDTLTK